jgi:hypothetical protein
MLVMCFQLRLSAAVVEWTQQLWDSKQPITMVPANLDLDIWTCYQFEPFGTAISSANATLIRTIFLKNRKKNIKTL